MKTSILSLLVLVAGSIALDAATPSPERLLPDGALAVLSVPDANRYRAAVRESATGRFWADDAMKPFKEKFLKELRVSVIEPLERELGIRMADYEELAQGQVTLAVTPNGWSGEPGQRAGGLLLVDVGDRESVLRLRLEELRRQWTGAGRRLRTQEIRGVEFSVLLTSTEELMKPLEKVFGEVSAPLREEAGEGEIDPTGSEDLDNSLGEAVSEVLEIAVGQSGSLLVVGTAMGDLERVLALQAGGNAQSLEENPGFQSFQGTVGRESMFYGWLAFQPFYRVMERQATQAAGEGGGNPMMPASSQLLAATGLSGLAGVGFGWQEDGRGSLVRLLGVVPESNRRGLFKLLVQKPKDSSPPRFVPADAVSFSRWRLDLRESWAGLEALIAEVSPQLSGALQFAMGAMGGASQSGFSFRDQFIGNLGDDLVGYEKAPRNQTLEDWAAPPSVLMIGSPDAEGLGSAFRTLMGMLPPTMCEVKEREFLGRKLSTLVISMPTDEGEDDEEGEDSGTSQRISFAASGGYLAMSGDDAALEEYLRGSESVGGGLRETAGLMEAAEAVGGTSTGMLGFENSREVIRQLFGMLRDQDGSLTERLGLSAALMESGDEVEAFLRRWLDFSLLPEFGRVEKYFHLTVYTTRWAPEGYRIDILSPRPPGLGR